MSSNDFLLSYQFFPLNILQFKPTYFPLLDEPKTKSSLQSGSNHLYEYLDSNDYAIFICTAFQYDLS